MSSTRLSPKLILLVCYHSRVCAKLTLLASVLSSYLASTGFLPDTTVHKGRRNVMKQQPHMFMYFKLHFSSTYKAHITSQDSTWDCREVVCVHMTSNTSHKQKTQLVGSHCMSSYVYMYMQYQWWPGSICEPWQIHLCSETELGSVDTECDWNKFLSSEQIIMIFWTCLLSIYMYTVCAYMHMSTNKHKTCIQK